MSEHAFAPYVRTLGRGQRARRSLTRDEARDAMTAILEGRVTDAQLGAFLMLLRVKEETPEELAGFMDVARAYCHKTLQPLPAVQLDWPSYAGKKKHSPWYLLSALLLSQQGISVLMHGGPEHTPGRLYTEQALQQLDIPVSGSVAHAADQLERACFAYLPLRHFCAPLNSLLQLREQLGLRSPINTLARSLNPAQASLSLQSVFHPAYLALHLNASLLCQDENVLLIKGEGGEVEWRPDARNAIHGLRCGQVLEDTSLEAVIGRFIPQTPPDIQDLKTLWLEDDDQAPHLSYGKHAVIHTAALALWGLQQSPTLKDAHTLALHYWQKRQPL